MDGDCEIDVIDTVESPGPATEDHVMATPTVIRLTPPPRLRVIGDLSDLDRAALHLGFPDSLVSPGRERSTRAVGSFAGFGAVPLERLAGDCGDALEVPVAMEQCQSLQLGRGCHHEADGPGGTGRGLPPRKATRNPQVSGLGVSVAVGPRRSHQT